MACLTDWVSGMLLSVPLTGAATSIIFVATNVCFSRRKSFVMTKNMLVKTKLLSRQSMFVMFVATNICRNKHNFVATKVLMRQAYFCEFFVFVFVELLFSCPVLGKLFKMLGPCI